MEDEVMRDGGQKPAGVLPKMCIVSLDMSPEAVEGYRLGKIRPRFEFSPMHSATMKIRGRDMVVSCEFPRIR